MRNRDIDLHFRLSKSEYETFMKKVKISGLNREQYIRDLIAKVEIKVPPSLDFLKSYRELLRIGSNIEQVLRIAHTRYFIDVPLLRKSLDELHMTQHWLWDEYVKKARLRQ